MMACMLPQPTHVCMQVPRSCRSLSGGFTAGHADTACSADCKAPAGTSPTMTTCFCMSHWSHMHRRHKMNFKTIKRQGPKKKACICQCSICLPVLGSSSSGVQSLIGSATIYRQHA